MTTSLASLARRHGLSIRKSTKGSGLMWLVDANHQLRSPSRGCTEDELRTLLSLPEVDPRAKAIWDAKPEPAEEGDGWEFGAEPPQ